MQVEDQVKSVEADVAAERNKAEVLVGEMDFSQRERYDALKAETEATKAKVASMQVSCLLACPRVE